MPKGGGKYGDVAEFAHVTSGAAVTVLIVLGGDRGSGFSVCGYDPEHFEALPELLRNVAKDIENDTRGDSNVDQI
jgi:hypothetical protein